MKNALLIVVAGATLAACSSTKNGGIMPARGGSSAQVTSVNISLPNRAQFKTEVADIETKMNGFHLIIGPVDATCANATNVSEVQDYASTPTISAQLQQGCDYDVILALGNKDATTQPLLPAQPPIPSVAPVAYNSQVKGILDASCVSCHGGKTAPDMSTYAAAKKVASRIQARVADGSMPTSGALSSDQQATIKAWVDNGMMESIAGSPTTPPAAGSTNSASKLTAVYYKNNKALRIAKEQIAGQSSIQAKLALQLQADGKAIGLVTGGGAPANSGGSGNNDPATQPPTPTDPAPVASTVTLPSALDFELVDAAGKTEKLSAAFKGKYMLLDFSQSGCGYCIQRAGEMDQDSNLQKQLDGSKCSHATFVPQDDLSSWYDAIGSKTSFTAKHSYQLNSGRMGKIVESFGVNFGGTPTFILIDANGKAVADDNGVPSDAISQHCR